MALGNGRIKQVCVLTGAQEYGPLSRSGNLCRLESGVWGHTKRAVWWELKSEEKQPPLETYPLLPRREREEMIPWLFLSFSASAS